MKDLDLIGSLERVDHEYLTHCSSTEIKVWYEHDFGDSRERIQQTLFNLPSCQPESTTMSPFKKATLVSAIMILVLQVLDLLTTFAVLSKGGTELNPLADFLINTEFLGIPIIWLPKITIPLTLIVSAVYLRMEPTLTRVAVSFWVAGFYTMVILSNSIVLLSQ